MGPVFVAGVAASVVGIACVVSACSSTTTSPTPTEDAGNSLVDAGGTDSSIAPDTSVGFDAAPSPENGCTAFVDRTGASDSRAIQWDLSVPGIPEHCMKVKAGQVVAWVNGMAVASFGEHPLVIYKPGGGTAPVLDEATGKATFTTPGLFGFACGIHPTMRGAILVE